MTIIDDYDDTYIKIRNCIYGFKCDQSWDEMTLTKKENVRFCENCEKEVFLVEKKGQLFKAIQLNRCVAIWLETVKSWERHLLGKVNYYDDN